MRVAPCTRLIDTLCPVDAWQELEFDEPKRPAAIKGHGTDRDGVQRYICTACSPRHTFTLRRWFAELAQRAGMASTYKATLMTEVLWMVQCDRVRPNTAARRVGVNRATALRWAETKRRQFERRAIDVCAEVTRNSIESRRSKRLEFPDAVSEGQFYEEKDRRWLYSSAAAELLFVLKATRRVGPAAYKDALRRVTIRANAGSQPWWAEVRQLRGRLNPYEVTQWKTRLAMRRNLEALQDNPDGP